MNGYDNIWNAGRDATVYAVTTFESELYIVGHDLFRGADDAYGGGLDVGFLVDNYPDEEKPTVFRFDDFGVYRSE